jgi:HAD superfamily hydrolase (TIGR01490 family)
MPPAAPEGPPSLKADVYPSNSFSHIRAMEARAAVFDVDYTLLQRSSTVAFARVAIKHKLIAPHMLIESALLHFRVQHGIANPRKLPRELNFLAGLPKSLLDDLADEVFLRYLIKSIYPDAISLIRQHLSRGCLVILATASLDFIIRPLAEFLRIPESHVITTNLEYADGMCTGRVDGKPCYGLEKLRRSAELLRDRNIPLEQAAFYSDSIIDLGMMSRVGYPVATNPDFRLRRHAVKGNWDIISLR